MSAGAQHCGLGWVGVRWAIGTRLGLKFEVTVMESNTWRGYARGNESGAPANRRRDLSENNPAEAAFWGTIKPPGP